MVGELCVRIPFVEIKGLGNQVILNPYFRESLASTLDLAPEPVLVGGLIPADWSFQAPEIKLVELEVTRQEYQHFRVCG